MLETHHFLQLVPQRVQRTLERLEKLIWHDRRDLPVFWTGKTHADHITWHEASKLPTSPAQPMFWGRMYEQTWFRIEIPAEYRKSGEWYLDWREQGESTAYIDGAPFSGFDLAHMSARLPKGTAEVWMESMCLETGIWSTSGQVPVKRFSITDEGCRFERATIVRRNDDAWHAYHDLFVLQNLINTFHKQHFPELAKPHAGPIPMNPLNSINPRYRKLLRQVDDAISVWETGGLTPFRKAMATLYKNFSEGTLPMHCVLTGHAHIDLVWLWPERCGESKAVHTFATANRLMDEYPEYRFGYSQPASYRAVGRRSPEMLKQVKKRIKQGKWEAVGALEVESDTQIACGEALARSLLLGQEGFKELTGEPSKIVWLPDVFGYTACMPQLMAQAGVKYFFTTKLTWGAITPFPYSTFIWRGHDGTEVTCHVSQGFGYNLLLLPEQTYSAVADHRQSDIHDEVILPVGFGDGGGGTTDEMCERARRLASLSGLPTASWGSLNEFFARIDKIEDRLPTYSGELYLQYHRGVMTTHGNLKEAMRVAERSLQVWEAANCATGNGNIDKEPWRRVVFAQFHDYIPGSSIREVYEEAIPELQGIAERAIDESVTVLGTGKPAKAESAAKGADAAEAGEIAEATAVFNPLPVERTLSLGDRLYKIGPLQGVQIDALEAVAHAPVVASVSKLENGRVKARFDKKGRITALSVDGKEVAIKGRIGDLAVYPALPHMFDAWELDRQTLTLGEVVETAATAQVEASGETYAVVSFSKVLAGESTVTIRYILEAGSPVLRVEYDVDWQEKRSYLRALFPTNYNGKEVRFGAPYGSTLRSQSRGQPYDESQWEVAGSRWAVISDDGEKDGFGVITEAKYGWSAKDGSLQLSLLHSASVTMDSQNATLREPSTLPFADIGKSTIRLAIGRFTAQTPREELAATLADTLFTDAVAYSGEDRSAGLLGIEGDNSLVPAWAKPVAKGEWILRLHETLGQRGKIRLNLAEGWQASLTDLSEVQGESLKDNTLAYGPYQLLSVRIKRGR